MAFYLKERDPLNWFYDNGLDGVIKGSQVVTRIQMTGLLRDYFVYMCVFMILLFGYTMFRYDAFAIDTTNLSPIDHLYVGLNGLSLLQQRLPFHLLIIVLRLLLLLVSSVSY